ncbi:hypothetical protein [Auraticoccus cholistanensis]|nr:hypothetical protein [Auraticoccus cholistanensis]
MSRKIPTLLAAGALLGAPLAVMAVAAPASADTREITFSLNPSTGSEASGTATLTAEENGDLTVRIEGRDLVPNMPHAQHIHGDVSGTLFTCPTDAADADGNGFLTVEEGLPDYGGIHISLTTEGDTAPDSGLAVDRMPTADEDGNLSYERTIEAADLPEGTIDALDNLHIVQHGVDANGNDEYDLDGLGESTFAKSLGVDDIPSEATDVATCGMVMPSGGVNTGGGTAAASVAGADQLGLVALGSVALLGAGAAAVVARRKATSAE